MCSIYHISTQVSILIILKLRYNVIALFMSITSSLAYMRYITFLQVLSDAILYQSLSLLIQDPLDDF